MFRQDKFNRTGSRALLARLRNKASDLSKRFLRDRAGNVMMALGVTAIPMLAATGAGIDYGRGMLVQNRLSVALDAAALAVGTALHKPVNELQTMAQSYFDANYPAQELGVPGNLSMTVNGDVISLSATASVDTAMMGIVGYNHLTVSASTEVTRQITGLEVVMVLDNTGSMSWNGKIDTLKTAAKDLVDILFGDEQSPQYLKIGMVPFAAAVNVGSNNKNSGWIDTNGLSSFHDMNFKFTGSMQTRFDVYDQINNKSWNGCVEARPSPMDVLDTPPSSVNGDTLWVPYFAPDEPDDNKADDYDYWYGNSYLNDNASSYSWSLQKRQETLNKYVNKNIYSDGPHYNCKTKPITPLTNNKTTIVNAINAMNATGTTNIPFGMAWGWRVISPGSPFTQGASYTDPKFRKAIILLTDGQNVIGTQTNHNKNRYGAYGYVKDGRLGTTNKNVAQTRLDERTADVCNNIKNANVDQPIIVYTITFQLNDGATKNLMRNCATDPEKYFDSPSNAVLKQNFRAIAGELSELRLSK